MTSAQVVRSPRNPAEKKAATANGGKSQSTASSRRSITARFLPCATVMCRSEGQDHRLHRSLGCGKSTVLRSLNRMNDLVEGFKLEGHVQLPRPRHLRKTVDPVVVRRYIGMVFQQPNPFAMSIYDNVAFGLRLNRYKGKLRGTGRAGAARRRAVG